MYQFMRAGLGFALLWGIVMAQPVASQAVSTQLRAAIAPTGTLRAAINYNNPLLAQRDRHTNMLSGVAVDLSRELARRLGIPVTLIPYGSAGAIGDASRTNSWDIAYLAVDPARAKYIDFTVPYLEVEGTYLVPADSPFRQVDELDHKGIRIAVTAKSAYDLYLSRHLKHAELVRFATTPVSIDMMVVQKLDAVAGVRTALLAAAQRLPGTRVLPGHFMTIPQAAAIPKGRPAAEQYVELFIEDLKASGFIARALKKNDLGPDDALIAPRSTTH